MRHWFKQQDREISVGAGRAILERELHRLGVKPANLEKVAERLNFKDLDGLMAALGRGDIQAGQVVGVVLSLSDEAPKTAQDLPIVHRRAPRAPDADNFRILGVGNLLTQTARCCHPVPNDPIVGYITRGRGVTIHRSDCPNVLRLKEEDRDRLIDVEWGASPANLYPVDIQIRAWDRQGLLRDISAVLANDKINVIEVRTRTDRKDMMAHMELSLEVADIGQLSRVLGRIGQLPNILEVKRKV